MMTTPLLAAIVIGYAAMKGIPVESLGSHLHHMVTEIPRLFGISEPGILAYIVAIVQGLVGGELAYQNVKKLVSRSGQDDTNN